MTTYRHRISGVGAGGELWVTTLHTVSAAGLSTVHAAFNTFAVGIFTGELAALYKTTQGMTGTVTDQLDPANDKNVAQASTSASHMGTAADTPSSPRACLVIALKTPLPTRHGRGRMFFPAPTVASINAAGNLSDAARAAIAADFGAQLTTLAATTTPVVWQRAVRSAPPGPFTYTPGAGVPISSCAVGNILGTQRRRTNKTVQSYTSASV